MSSTARDLSSQRWDHQCGRRVFDEEGVLGGETSWDELEFPCLGIIERKLPRRFIDRRDLGRWMIDAGLHQSGLAWARTRAANQTRLASSMIKLWLEVWPSQMGLSPQKTEGPSGSSAADGVPGINGCSTF
jgi:hypothetical protein